MPKRTQIVCLHEGKAGRSIDPIFIRNVLKALDPKWVRPWTSSVINTVDCGGRSTLIDRMPAELQKCLDRGGDTTLLVLADLDHDMAKGEDLKSKFWEVAKVKGITRPDFDKVVFAFAKDRLENWIEFLLTGKTDESQEGPRLKHERTAAEAAKVLAKRCLSRTVTPPLCPSLAWSCQNWRALDERMRD